MPNVSYALPKHKAKGLNLKKLSTFGDGRFTVAIPEQHCDLTKREGLASAPPPAEAMYVTKEMAREWATDDPAINRPIKRNNRERLTRAIVTGQWKWGPDIVVISHGKAIEGNHRLHALLHTPPEIEGVCMQVAMWDGFKSAREIPSGLGVRRSIADQLGGNRRIVEITTALTNILQARAVDVTESELVAAVGNLIGRHAQRVVESYNGPNVQHINAGLQAVVTVRLAQALHLGREDLASEIIQQWREYATVGNGRWASVTDFYRAYERKSSAHLTSGSARQRNNMAKAWIAFDPSKRDDALPSRVNPQKELTELQKVLAAILKAVRVPADDSVSAQKVGVA